MNNISDDNIVCYVDENGKKVKCDILCDLETKDKNYIIYTDNNFLDDGTKKIYASSYTYNKEDMILQNINTEEEWKMIESILSYLTKEN